MPKKILIVESDAGVSRMMRSELESRSFEVEETADGKGSVEMIRRVRPDLVLLAVDLAAGQNGYIICGKLKKDDELKATPVIIVGNPDGFAQHKKLKTRADEYLAKPVEADALIERVGALIGLPEAAAEDLVDESLSLSELVEDDEPAPEEIAVVPDDATVQGDPELDALDAAFDGISDEPPTSAGEDNLEELNVRDDDDASAAGSAPAEEDEALTALSGLGEDDAPAPAEDTGGEAEEDPLSALDEAPQPEPVRAAPARPAPRPTPPVRSTPAPTASPGDPAELRNLKAKVAELQAALEDAQGRASDADARVSELEAQLTDQTAELEAARSSGGKNDKEFFALREAANKKDKEILRLKNELNEKDKEIVELRDREMSLEQQVSESSGEISRRDAQIKTLTTRAEQLAAEKRKIEQQIQAAKDEARSATAKLSTIQEELDSAAAERDEARARAEQLEAEAAELREQLASTSQESEGARQELAEAHRELESLRAEVASSAAQHADELDGLRKRVAELEDAASRNEDRVAKLYQRIKSDEKMRDKTKKALNIAIQLIDEQAQSAQAFEEAEQDADAA